MALSNRTILHALHTELGRLGRERAALDERIRALVAVTPLFSNAPARRGRLEPGVVRRPRGRPRTRPVAGEVCHRCGKPFEDGQSITHRNFPTPGTAYHPKLANGTCDLRTSVPAPLATKRERRTRKKVTAGNGKAA